MPATLTPQKKTKRKTTISSGQNTLHSVAEQDTTAPIVFIEIYRWLSLYKGIDKSQRLLYKRTLNDFKMLYLNEEISLLAMEAVTKHDSLEPADILIGVTGVYYNIPVYTHNTKHFKLIKNISLYQEVS